MQLQYNELEEEISKQVNKIFPRKDCFVAVQPGNVVVPRKFIELGDSIRQMATYPSDVWVVSYPRAGSTWVQEMVWLLGHRLDFDAAKNELLALRSPIVELSALFSEDHVEWTSSTLGNTIEMVRNIPQPRFARSHLPWHLLPEDIETVKPKIIYIARNPKDLCVSFYHYCKLMHGLQGPFEDFLELFLQGHTPFGSYWKHVLPFWKHSIDSNIFFIKYEDMKKDLPGVIRKCARFLKLDYQLTEEDSRRLCEHLQFNHMQVNKAVNLEFILNNNDKSNNNIDHADLEGKFIRKGQIGDWKNYIPPKTSKRFDEWIESNSRGSGLKFSYE